MHNAAVKLNGYERGMFLGIFIGFATGFVAALLGTALADMGVLL